MTKLYLGYWSKRSSDQGTSPKKEKEPKAFGKRPKYGHMFQPWEKKSLCQHLSRPTKKLILVLANSSLVIETGKKNYVTLERVPCIYYPLRFQKHTTDVKVLINLSSEVNAMTPAYTAKLHLKIWKTNIKAYKIDGFTFNTFEIVLTKFQVENKLDKARFF